MTKYPWCIIIKLGFINNGSGGFVDIVTYCVSRRMFSYNIACYFISVVWPNWQDICFVLRVSPAALFIMLQLLNSVVKFIYYILARKLTGGRLVFCSARGTKKACYSIIHLKTAQFRCHRSCQPRLLVGFALIDLCPSIYGFWFPYGIFKLFLSCA